MVFYSGDKELSHSTLLDSGKHIPGLTVILFFHHGGFKISPSATELVHCPYQDLRCFLNLSMRDIKNGNS